jgi:3-hydroxy-9,10-secoandrosta-1,3,5(10)-triene-9,17-dione monooxygenase reductase component
MLPISPVDVDSPTIVDSIGPRPGRSGPERSRLAAVPDLRPSDLPASPPELLAPDTERLRHVLGHFPTGVAVITAMTPSGPVGMAVNSFTSLSLDPPLILFCPASTSTTWPSLRAATALAVNVLASDQTEVSRSFARRAADRFASAPWREGVNGAPLLTEALCWMECTIESEHAAGDHTVVISRIDRMATRGEAAHPLVFFRGEYFSGVGAITSTTNLLAKRK